MGTLHERNDEMFDQLAEAVFAGDLRRAEGVLGEMHAVGYKSEAIRRAKRAAGRERFAPPPLAVPFVLPVAGAKVGDTLGGGRMPRLDRDKPKRRRRG